MNSKLPLYAEVLLLALKDKEGTILPLAEYRLALGGAILAELMLHGKITIDDPKKKIIGLKDSTPIGDELLDECLLKIRDSKRPARAQTWVQRFSNIKRLKHRIAAMLCQRGILRDEPDKILLLFERHIYPEINHAPEQEIVQRLKSAVFGESDEIAPGIIILLSLAKSTNLLKSFLSRSEQKQYKKRIEKIVNGEIVGKATQEALQAVQAAVLIACMVPVIASTATH